MDVRLVCSTAGVRGMPALRRDAMDFHDMEVGRHGHTIGSVPGTDTKYPTAKWRRQLGPEVHTETLRKRGENRGNPCHSFGCAPYPCA